MVLNPSPLAVGLGPAAPARTSVESACVPRPTSLHAISAGARIVLLDWDFAAPNDSR
jgi:hypothetical protein